MNVRLGVFFVEEAKEQGSRFKHVRWNIVKHDASLALHEVQEFVAKERKCNMEREGCRVVASGVADNMNMADDAVQEWMNGMRLLLG